MVARYDRKFYEDYRAHSLASARAVLTTLYGSVQPGSVVDLGCGIGTWLAAAKDLGSSEILGVDGDHVDRDQLLIPPERFLPADLSRPADLGKDARRYDLAMSLEVAEHLPESSAASFVEALTRFSDLVLFSAAIPHQGGTGHINEQWPSYWGAAFARQGYRMIDLIRPSHWQDPQVAYYYAQNCFLYVAESALDEHSGLRESEIPPDHWSLETVHPARWAQANDPKRLPLRSVLRGAPYAAFNALKRRIPGLNALRAQAPRKRGT